MKVAQLVAVSCALALASGCMHAHSKTQTPPPPKISQPQPEQQSHVQTPPPTPTPKPKPNEPPVPVTPPLTDERAAEQPAKKPVIRKAKPSPATPATTEEQATAATQAPATTPTEAAAAPAPATSEPPVAAATNEGSSPIGQLSAGDEDNSVSLRRQTSDLISWNDRRLRTIHKGLSTDDQHTVAQVRKFQQQARQALAGGDLHAAHTLATKAKLLLDELLKT